MPNGVADTATSDDFGSRRSAQPGRAGPHPRCRAAGARPQSVPGNPIPPPNGRTLPDGTVSTWWPRLPYNNPVRAGYSFGIADLLNGAPRAAADDNYNPFDPFPIGHTGEVNDRDFFDSAGGLILPVDRMRRFVTPVDIDGIGPGAALGRPLAAGDVGADALRPGRLRRLFPTPRRPGLISVAPDGGAAPGTIVYPSAGNDLFYTSGPNPANLTFPSYLPDVTNNPLHGFEAAKNPNLPGANGGGMPADENVAAGIPPTPIRPTTSTSAPTG